jgi:hypothetical protein
MGCRARSPRQANEMEIVSDVQVLQLYRTSDTRLIGPESDDSDRMTGDAEVGHH